MTTQLILFDIDGTLLRTGGAGRTATEGAMTEIFGTAADLQNHHFGGKTDWYTLIELLTPQGISAEEIIARMPDYIDAMGRHLQAIIGDYIAEAMPGALEAVEIARKREDLVLGIVTGNVSSTAPIKLRAGGFDPAWFPVGAFGNESMNRNDLPRNALARAIDYAGRDIAPADVVVVGDTPRDIEAARANNMRVIAVATGFGDPTALEAAKPDVLLDDLTTMLDYL